MHAASPAGWALQLVSKSQPATEPGTGLCLAQLLFVCALLYSGCTLTRQHMGAGTTATGHIICMNTTPCPLLRADS